MARKNPLRSALILSAVTAALAAFSYFVIRPQHESSEKSKDKASLLFGDLDRTKVVDFEIHSEASTARLKRKAQDTEQWLVTVSEKTFEGDKLAVDGIVSTILAAKKESTISNADLTTLGLAPAKYSLTVPEGEKKRELLIGDDTPVDYLVYAKWADAPEVFTTTRSLRFSVDKKISELRNKKVFPLKAADIAGIDLKIPADGTLPARDFAFVKTDGAWNSTLPRVAKLDKAEVDKFLDGLAALAVVDFVSEVPAERAAKFGFGRPIATFTVHPADAKATPMTWTLAQVREPNKPGQKEPSFKFYLARMDQESTYEVSSTFKDQFKTDFLRFRNKIVSEFDKALVASFTIQDGATSLSFAREGAGWKLKAKTAKGEVGGHAKTELVDKALESIAHLRATEFLDGQTPFGLGLSRPSRVIEINGKKDGKEESLLTLFLGKKLPGGKVVARTEGLDSAAAVVLGVDEVLPLKAEAYLEAVAPAPTNGTPAADKDQKGSKRVMLEPTVKATSELRKLPGPIVKPGYKYTAEITLGSGQKMTITFDAVKAPYTVSNFLHLARNHFYDNVAFHRVIADFVVQGGDPTGTGRGGPGWKFDNEDNDLKHKRGAISMAHAGRDTNGSQFFLVLKPQPHLDGIHTVYGEITSGLDLLDTIRQGDVMKKVEVFEEKM